MTFYEHWYDSQASYKGGHALLGYQPFEEREGRDVNNDKGRYGSRLVACKTVRSLVICMTYLSALVDSLIKPYLQIHFTSSRFAL